MKHPHTLEAFNRASFDPPTPEIIPAETMQADERPTPRSVLSSIPARDFFAAVGITATLWFIAAAVSVIFPGA
jgi:hypothetical protein